LRIHNIEPGESIPFLIMIRSMLASAHRRTAASSLASSAGIAPSIVTRQTRSYADLAAVLARAAAGFRYPISAPRPFSASVAASDAIDEPPVEQKEELASNPPPWRKAKSERERLLESLPVTFADISRANVAIRTGIKRTPCVKSYFLSELLGANIFLKPEIQQFTGSFKERGARNAILALLRDTGEEKLRSTGVIVASAGNHVLALAYHGKDLGVTVMVVMPAVAPLAKVDTCRVSRCNIDVVFSSAW